MARLNVFLHKEKGVDLNTLARNYIFHLHMTQAKSQTDQRNSPVFQEVLLSTISCVSCFFGAMHIYLFYFVLDNNKQMTEQRYILQTISD